MASYTTTVFGVDGLPYGVHANLGRQISTDSGAQSQPRPARAHLNGQGPQPLQACPLTPRLRWAAAPLMPEGWGQGN
jgi:hypothetical protein